MNTARIAILAALAAVALSLALAWPRAEFVAATSSADWAATPENVARGAYLARAGNCIGCHTVRGGAAYAGGRAIDTPFGRFYSPNLTPDRATGIGAWNADDFWNALHNGIGRDGRLLYPSFPYPNYTRVTRADADALFAYFSSLAPRRQPNRPHALRFPYDQQAVLAGWRLLYFRPAVQREEPRRDAAWNRGAYLVEGLGHCGACHSERNRFGAPVGGLDGGLMAAAGWHAPSLALHDWSRQDIAALLGSGISARGAATGPMAEVVARSLQHLTQDDLGAIADYLKTLPAPPAPPVAPAPAQQVLDAGRRIYEARCAQCHGDDGRGHPGATPPLAGNGALASGTAVNAIRMVVNGGFPPSTRANPRPHGMPPFGHQLSDTEVAAVLTYVGNSWGNTGPAVSSALVNRYRAVPLD